MRPAFSSTYDCCIPSGTQHKVQVEVRTISDIEKDYSLVRTKLSLLRVDPSVATQIYSECMGLEALVCLPSILSEHSNTISPALVVYT